MKMHSYVPGQCKHTRISQERDKERLRQMGYLPEETKPESVKDFDSVISLKNEKNQTQKIFQPCIFEVKQKCIQKGDTDYDLEPSILKYNSLDDYDRFYLQTQNISNLRGCFEKDGYMGQIHLNTFNLNIKSLVSNFSYQKNFKLS